MQMRTKKPEAGNKFYNNGNNGGYSWCVNGQPMDKGCNVLANCVGYACGRFNEIIGEFKYKTLCCNAEWFIERAIAAGLSVVNKPSLGGIMVWQKGSLDDGDDGAGHVAIVERIDGENKIFTSESAWNGSSFWNQTRTNSNGRWGMGSAYKFRGCIVNPAIGYKPFEPTPKPQPSSDLKVGDKVKIIGTGNGSSYGTSNTAYGLGWTRYITDIYEGRPFPYQVGNQGKTDSANTTGFYSKSALQKID